MKMPVVKKWIKSILPLIIVFFFITIIALVIALNIANKRLERVAHAIEELGEQHITTNVALNTTLPLNSVFQISQDVTVGINLVVETDIPLNVEIPVNQNILIPFKIGVKDYIKLDTTIFVTDDVYALVEDTLHFDQKVNMPTSKNRGVNVPIKASIPLNEKVKVSFNQAIPVHSIVPIDLLIIDTLPVGLNIKVPVKLMIPVRIPVSTTARVSFPESVPVVGDIPIDINIPVDISLSETDLATYFIKIANGLRGFTKLKATDLTVNENN